MTVRSITESVVDEAALAWLNRFGPIVTHGRDLVHGVTLSTHAKRFMRRRS